MPKPKQDDFQEKSFDVRTLKHVQSDDFKFVYANNCNVLASVEDVRLLFGQILIHPDGQPQILDTASVTVTWGHLQRIRDVIDRLIAARDAKIKSQGLVPTQRS